MRLAALIAVTVFVYSAVPIRSLAADNENSLSFFRISEKEYQRDIVTGNIYGRFSSSPSERQPAHVIPESAIDSIVIAGFKPLPTISFYEATFKLNPAEAEKLGIFLDENREDRLFVKLGTRTLPLALVDPSPVRVTGAYTTILLET